MRNQIEKLYNPVQLLWQQEETHLQKCAERT